MAELELNRDGWERFERAVDAAVKSGPKHRVGKLKDKGSVKAKDRKNAGAQRKLDCGEPSQTARPRTRNPGTVE